MAISVTKLTPATGPAGAVTGVAAVGTNLTIVTKVEMYLQSVGPSGAVGCPFTLVDATNLTFTTMLSMVAGAAVVRVTASDFSSSTIGFTFTLPAPVVTSMAPDQGPAGTAVTLAGQWLDSVTSVSVGGVPTTIGAQTPTSLSFVTPDGLIGPQVVVVTNATGSTQSTFTYPTPPTPPTPKVCIRKAWLTLGALTMPLEDPDVGYYCTELDLGFPAPREVVDNRPDMDGVTDRTMVSSSRVVSANITANGAPVDAIATQFSPFMVASVRPVLHYVLDRGASSGERTLTVRGSNYTCPISGSATRQIQLQWVAADPVAYDVTLEKLDGVGRLGHHRRAHLQLDLPAHLSEWRRRGHHRAAALGRRRAVPTGLPHLRADHRAAPQDPPGRCTGRGLYLRRQLHHRRQSLRRHRLGQAHHHRRHRRLAVLPGVVGQFELGRAPASDPVRHDTGRGHHVGRDAGTGHLARRVPDVTALDVIPEAQATPYYPVPPGRGRWRLQLMARQFAYSSTWSDSIMAEITDARSRRVETVKNGGATLTFTLDGHSPSAALIGELSTDVIAWRWNHATGADVCVFRGPVCQTQDSISEQVHTVTVTCHDYLAMLARRILTVPYNVTQQDQDWIVYDLVNLATNTAASDGTSFGAGAWLPLFVYWANPDGSNRAARTGQLRDRTYTPNSKISELLDNLSKVIGGFDYDILPLQYVTQGTPPVVTTADHLRVFYPRQGVTRSDIVLAYGSNVASVTRSVNSADYANYQRLVGATPPGGDTDAPPMFSEKWNSDANNVTVDPVGLWMSEADASDVSVQSTLDQQVSGELAESGVLVPSYTLGLTPGAYVWGKPNMGDTVPLVIQSGRLNVNTNVDVVGITYDIGDDGQEDVELTVGRPVVTFGDLFTDLDRSVNALTRR